MPAVMEQVDRMSADEKLRLIVYIANSMSAVPNAPAPAQGGATMPFARQKPRISDFIGYGARFHKLRTTEEWMKELREGEEE